MLNNKSISDAPVIVAIQNKSLPPTAMAIILYSLSIVKPDRMISFNHRDIRNELGIKRTSFFTAMKSLQELGIITKRRMYTYRLNLNTIIPQSSVI